MAKYFGTNGIRGPIDVLTPELAYKAAFAIGLFLKKGPVLLAMDARLTGPLLKERVVTGLIHAGRKIIDLGIISTPTAEFMVRKLKPAGLIIITASHNPAKDNGLKVMDGDEVSLSKERAEAIEKLIDNPPKTNVAPGTVEIYSHAVEDHVSAMLDHVNASKTKGKRLLLDYGNGMAATIAPILFKRLGCEVTSINSHIDGSFPGRPSEPTKENIRILIETVGKGRYDAGIAWDGDGDRVVFVDEKGTFVIGDKVFAIATIHALKHKKGAVVTTVATSKAVEDITKKYGSRIIYTKIGAPYLCEEMVMSKGILGGEEVGGVMWPEVSLAKDGFLTAAKLVEGLAEKPLSEWVREIPEYHNAKTKVGVGKENKQELVERIAKGMAKKGTVNTLDGIRIDFKDGWVLVRASGTENYIRVFAEAKTEKRMNDLLLEYVENVRKCVNS